MSTKTRLHFAAVLFLVICAAGVLLRVHSYAVNRSLWADEAMLALNITERSFRGLFEPLDFDQAAPVGFLLLQKAVVGLFGSRDFVLRLIPLLAGLASVPIMFLVARAYGARLAAFLSLGLLALSPRLIYYSSELKQYSTDVLATLVLLLVASKPLEEKAGPRAFVALGGAGSLALWVSHPSVFVFAGILLTLGVTLAARRDARRLRRLAGVGAVWGASFGLCYFVSLRSLGSNGDLAAYWSGSFAPMPPWRDLSWYGNAIIGMVKDPTQLPVNAVTAALLALGALSLALRQRRLMLVLLTPFLLALAASALRMYPFSGRLLLFLVPLLLLLLAEGVERMWLLLRRVSRPAGWLVTALLCLYLVHEPAVVACRNVQSPPMREEIRPVMAHVRENRLSTDLIYVYHGAAPAFRFYAPLYGFGRGDYSVGVPAEQGRAEYLGDADRFSGAQRVWFVFSHIGRSWTVNDRMLMLDHLDGLGRRIDDFASPGASAELYDLRRTK